MIAASPSDPDGKIHLATSLDGLGKVLQDKGDTAGALANRRRDWPSAKNWPGSILTTDTTEDSWLFLTIMLDYRWLKPATLPPLWRTTGQNSVYLSR